MSTFILVHGAYHGGWCWQRLSPLLEADGHTVLTPDLPGHGSDPAPYPSMTLPAYIDQICDVVTAVEGPVTLVGHSMAGMVVAGVSERLPDRLACVVYLTAYMPQVGPAEAISDLMRLAPSPNRRKREMVEVEGVPCVTVAPDDLEPYFYTGAATADIDWVRPQLIPEPAAVFKTAVQLTERGFGRVPRFYVSCRRDKAIPADLQDILMERTGVSQQWSMDCGHSPFLTAPAELAEILMEGERLLP